MGTKEAIEKFEKLTSENSELKKISIKFIKTLKALENINFDSSEVKELESYLITIFNEKGKRKLYSKYYYFIQFLKNKFRITFKGSGRYSLKFMVYGVLLGSVCVSLLKINILFLNVFLIGGYLLGSLIDSNQTDTARILEIY